MITEIPTMNALNAKHCCGLLKVKGAVRKARKVHTLYVAARVK